MKILVIDDDTAKTDLLGLLVEKFPHDVIFIDSGESIIEKIKQIKPDLLIFDIFSPGLDGFEICRKIREFSKVPILVVTVMNNPDLIARALDAGADDVLTKPVSNSLLSARLHGLIKRGRSRKKSIGQIPLSTNFD